MELRTEAWNWEAWELNWSTALAFFPPSAISGAGRESLSEPRTLAPIDQLLVRLGLEGVARVRELSS